MHSQVHRDLKRSITFNERGHYRKGIRYGNEYLISDEDLKSLHKFEEFHTMVQLCNEREELAHKKERPDVKYIYSKKEGNLLLTLHGDQENIQIVEPYWKSVLTQDYTLALPQSSQIQFSDGFVWDDIERERRIKRALQ